MSIISNSKDYIVFVGGRGTKAGDQYAGGGCTKEFWGDLKNPSKALADVMGTNGEALSDLLAGLGETSCDVTNNGSGKVRITKAGQGWFSNCSAGLIVRAVFAAVYTSGRYEVTAVDDTNGDWIDIDENYSANTTCSARAGGAMPKIQTASDDFTAANYNCYILTNKPESFADESDQIDIDTGGGSPANNTWKRIVGIDDNGVELADGLYVTIDANGKACHGIHINEIDNIEHRRIYSKNTSSSHYGFFVNCAATHYNFNFIECKADGCKYALYVANTNAHGLYISGGYYKSTLRHAINFANRDGLIVKAHVVGGNASYEAIRAFGYKHTVIAGCVIEGSGATGGVLTQYATRAFNNVFYDVTHAFNVYTSTTILVEYNNICILHDKASGKFINRTSGSIAYSDYSCLWALDGAPNASDRWGGSGRPEHAIEEDPGVIDAANGNFRLRNPNVLRGGKPDIADNVTQMGVVMQKYQFAGRARTANFGRLQTVR